MWHVGVEEGRCATPTTGRPTGSERSLLLLGNSQGISRPLLSPRPSRFWAISLLGHLASGPSRFWAISLLGHLAASGASCSVPHRALAPHAQLGLTPSSSRSALLTARYGVRSCALGPDGRSGKYGGTHGQDTGDDLCGGVERGTLEFRRSTRTRVGSSIHDRTRKEVTQGTGS